MRLEWYEWSILTVILAAAVIVPMVWARLSRRGERLREAALPSDALFKHILSQASRADGSRTATSRYRRMSAAPWAVEALRRAYSECAALSSAAPLTPASQWLCDNARALEEAASSVNESLRGAPPLPAFGGETRIESFARELAAHTDARIDAALLRQSVEAYQTAHQLTEDELWLLPTAARKALVVLSADIARDCVATEYARLAARRWADGRLAGVAPEHPPAAFRRAARHPAFIEQLLSALLEREDSQGLNWMDAYLASLDQTAERAVCVEHTSQTRARDWMGNAVISLKKLGSMEWNGAQEALSAVHGALLGDPSGTYPSMDFASRCMYRGRVARVAKKSRRPEALIAKRAAVLASQNPGDDIAGHVGYYLIDNGQPQLWKSLGGMPASVSAARAMRRASAPMYIASIALFDALLALALRWTGAPWWAAILALPVLSEASRTAVNTLVMRFTPPVPLPRIAPDHIETRTLVVVPTLLTSSRQALDMARHLSVLRFANPQDGIDYMLLADFADAKAIETADDSAITREASEAVEALNQVWGGGYIYIHRAREWDEGMNRYIGSERKRGALEALNEWLVEGKCSCELAASTINPAELHNRYKTVITLDADTQLPPDTALTLAGALAHPLNSPRQYEGKARGHAILQPRMEVSSSTVHSRLAKIYGGEGGVDLYVTATSDVYQNIAGAGSFGGKGAYDPYAFSRAVRGRIRKGTVLSHDLLEGCLARAALLCDVPLYDGQPQTLSGWYKRQHRWTRGDWQLLPWLGMRIRGENTTFRNPLSLLSRYKIYDNLRRSALPVFELALWIAGVASGSLPVLIAALLAPRVGVLIRPSVNALKAAAIRLALLPGEVKVQIDAIARTLTRLFFTHKNLLEWTTSAQSERATVPARPKEGTHSLLSVIPAPAVIAASAIIHPWFAIAAAPLALAWLCAGALERWLDGSAWPDIKPDAARQEDLRAIARDTWRFFEDTVSELTSYLPPDNTQIEPPRGAAMRTSPTNIGMYLLSCSGALALGFIQKAEFLRRVADTTSSLERMETWRGHLLNWYDTSALNPLRPRYVSSVDSGNFALCATAVAQAVRGALDDELCEEYADLPARLEALVDRIEFQALYDDETSLFYVGVDAESGSPSDSRYDLLASEARMFSFFAVMRREAPLKHWRSLGRTLTAAFPASFFHGKRGGVLLSWAGTAFEYLMPTVLFPHMPGTLLGDSACNAVRTQISRAGNRPWGVSESGYYGFDPDLNYQYKAFGLPALSLRGGAPGEVIAPYASALALAAAPCEAADNLVRMRKMGWADEHGLFEAADWDASRIPPTRSYALVRSHMAHHQGMILCSIANLLTGGVLVKAFSGLPQAEAYALLLEERTPTRSMLKHAVRPRYMAPPAEKLNARRSATIGAWPVAVQLMHGAGTTLMCDAHGNGYLARNGVMLTRWRPDPTERENGMRVYVCVDGGEVNAVGTYRDESIFENGRAETTAAISGIEVRMLRGVSPLDGAAVFDISLLNHNDKETRVELASFAEVALSAQQADVAHPAFRNLFVETVMISETLIAAKRRPRAKDEVFPLFAHWIGVEGAQEVRAQTDRAAFMPRGCERPETLSGGSGTIGDVVDPCLSLGVSLSIPPDGEKHVLLGWAAADSEAEATRVAARYQSFADAQRLFALAATQAEVAARHLGLDAARQTAAQTLASYLLYHGQPANRAKALEENRTGVSGLWALGISGDMPVVTACVSKASEPSLARQLLRCHEYLRRLGLWFDLVLLAEGEAGYDRPVRDALREAVAASPARDLIGKPSGVFLPDAQSLTSEQAATLRACSALTLDAEAGTLASQLAKLRASTGGVRAEARLRIPEVAAPTRKITWGKKAAAAGIMTNRYLVTRPVGSLREGNAEAVAIPPFANGAGLRKRHFGRNADTHLTTAPDVAYPAVELKPLPELEQHNGFGGFMPDGSYVIERGALPPAPWCNILANPSFGMIATDRGSALSWVGNSGLGRMTAFCNDPLRARVTSAIYIRDEETGAYRSATPDPCGNAARVRHCQGYSVYESDAVGIAVCLTVFTDAEKRVACRMLALRNPGDRRRLISITAYQLWSYKNAGEARLLSTGVDEGVVWARHPGDGRTLYMAMTGEHMRPHSHTTDGIAFLGTGGAERPRAMELDALDSIGGELPCAASRALLTLEPGEEAEVCVLVGAED